MAINGHRVFRWQARSKESLMSLQVESQAVAGEVAPKVGLAGEVILSIASVLLPALLKIWLGNCGSANGTNGTNATDGTDKTAALKAYLNDRYCETTGTFDQALLDQCRPEARRSARHAANTPHGRMTRVQLDAITASSLERARSGDPATVSACLAEAAALPDVAD